MGEPDQANWGCASFAADDASVIAVKQAIAVGQADINAGRFFEFTDPASMTGFLDELAADISSVESQSSLCVDNALQGKNIAGPEQLGQFAPPSHGRYAGAIGL